MDWGLLSFLSGIVWKIFARFKDRPNVAIEAETKLVNAQGTSNIDGTVWNLWEDWYVWVCVSNTGAPTTVKDAYISIIRHKGEVIRFRPWKTHQHINYKRLWESPEIDKPLVGARIGTNDAWGPHIVLFTAQNIVRSESENPILSDGAPFLVVEVVGQKPRRLFIGKKSQR